MKKLVLIISLLMTIILITSCKRNSPQFTTFNYYGYLNTISYVIVETTKDIDLTDIKQDIESILQKMEDLFGKDESLTNTINNNAGKTDLNNQFYQTKVSDTYLGLLKLAKELSDGETFDITIGALSKVWNISEQAEYCIYANNCKLPTTEEILTARNTMGIDKIVIDNDSVYIQSEGTLLDFGAIAKGYASDLIATYLQTKAINFFVINLGGNVYVHGQSLKYQEKNQELFISLENPLDASKTILDIYETNTNVVTSASTHRYIIVDGIKYSHILNPKTGYPVDNDLLSVTILGDQGVMCDYLSTKCFVMGLVAGTNYLQTTSYQGIFVTKNKEIYIVGNINIQLTDQEFQII